MRIGIVRPTVSIVLLGIGILWVFNNYGLQNVFAGITKLSFLTVGLIFFSLVASAFAASLRFKAAADSTGFNIRFRDAMAAVGAGSLAGALFFQIAGQLMARGFMMRQLNVPFAAVVTLTLYERVVAAALSGLLALAGALYIFGHVYVDLNAGGFNFIKIVVGLISAAAAGALLGYGRTALRSIVPSLTRNLVYAGLRMIALTLLVQILMMAAYIVAAHALSPQTSIFALAAASAIVMFTASIPISLAGWGIREMSAIVSLGAIGVAGNDALTAAIVIGLGSMLSMMVILMLGFQRSSGAEPGIESRDVSSFNFDRALAWSLPIIAAVLVLFQIYIPLGSGLLNVNMADPVAVLAGALFVLRAFKQRQMPQWRVSNVNLAVALATAALGGSLLLGAYRFGGTDWALVNRFVGWFVILAFAATGALIVNTGGHRAFRIVLMTYAGATIAVALLEIVLVAVNNLGFTLPATIINPQQIEAFSQNRNFFAFQLLMATVVTIVLVRESYLRIALIAGLIIALWLAGSRSGYISIVVVLAFGYYFNTLTRKDLALSVISAVCVILISAILLPALGAVLGFGPTHSQGTIFGSILGNLPELIPTGANTQERLVTIFGGWRLFTEHPIFGAGLGAFRKELILGTSGIPLLIHSTVLWLLAELGLVGFLVFFIPAVFVLVTEWRFSRDDLGSAIIALCFVAFGVMSTPADMLYQRTFWLVIGAALALPRCAPRRSITFKDASKPEENSARHGTLTAAPVN